MPREPPVDMSPQARLRARFSPGVGYSAVTFDQSQSSSSATSCARPVSEPWPISERAIRMTTSSFGLMKTQTPSSLPLPAPPMAIWLSALRMPPASMPIARPPPAAAAVARNLRRDRVVMVLFIGASPSALLLVAGRQMDRLADSLIGAASTDVGHGGVDIAVAGFRLALEQRRSRHDLAGLAVAALRDLQLQPGL